MARASRKWDGPRVPPAAADGMQLNCCRNPLCDNYAIPPISDRKERQTATDGYRIIGTTAGHKAAMPALQCQRCQTSVLLISNRAVTEERDRLLVLGAPIGNQAACKNSGCANHVKGVKDHPDGYQRFGKTAIGSPRYRCRTCGSTVSEPKGGTHRLRRPEKTLEIFRGLINKVAMRRLCELADVGAETLYQRIELIHDRCRALAAEHEAELMAGRLRRERMHIALDRQDHILNSGTSHDRRPSLLLSTASAEAHTGYILAQHLNFDPNADPFALELDAREAGDPDRPPAFRKHGRLWLPYERLETRDPATESEQSADKQFRPASRGAQVHDSIALAAHLQIIERMTRGADYLQLSLDREPGIERLSLLTFQNRMRAGSVDAFLVRINKAMTQAMKRTALAEAERQLAEARTKHPSLSDVQVLLAVIERDYVRALRYVPAPRDRWISHPYPTMSEPERAVLCLTDDGDRPRAQVVSGFARASLRSIDRYFMQVRRKIHVLERPIATSSASFRRWYGYSAYSALVVMRLLEIFRVVYNYHLTGKQSTTPAQRLGLAARPYSLAELVGMAG